jgi:hypothetical protein
MNTDAGIGWIDHEGKRTLRFHTNAYFRDFKEAVENLRTLVRTDNQIQKKFSTAVSRLLNRQIQEVI